MLETNAARLREGYCLDTGRAIIQMAQLGIIRASIFHSAGGMHSLRRSTPPHVSTFRTPDFLSAFQEGLGTMLSHFSVK